MSDSRRAVVWVSCAMVLLHVVCVAALGCLSPDSSGRVPFRIVQVATGLGLLFFVPGMLFCLGVLRRPQLPLFDLLCFSFAANSVLYITVTTGIKATGHGVTPGRFLVSVAALTLVGTVWLTTRRPATQVVNDFGSQGRLALFGALGLVAFVLLTNRPFLPGEDDYWSLDTLPRIQNAEFKPVDLAGYGVTSKRDGAWHSIGRQRFRLSPGEAQLVFENSSSESPSIDLWLLVQAHGEGEIQLWKDTELLQSIHAHPRFRMGEHPRNYPPPNFVLHQSVPLQPGRTGLKLTYSPDPSAPRDAFLLVTDLSNLDRAAFMKAFQRRYLIDNIGDRQEQLELARMLNSKLFLYTHSYNGTLYDGGGYTISNLPFPFYAHSFALLLMGDSVTSLDFAYLVILAGVFAATVRLAMPETGAPSRALVALALVASLNFATLMRFMIETLYIHPLLLLLLLVTSHFLLKRDTAGFLAFGLFTCLTKGGAVFLLFMFVASLLFFAHQRGETARLFAKLAGVVLVVVVLIVVSGHAVGALREWQKTLHGTDYGGRFSLLGRAANGDTDVMRRLGGVALRQSAIVLVASCFLPFGCLLRAERGSLFFLSVGLLAHFTVCASNPVWTRTEPAAHHPTYFSPAANLLAVAGLRSLSAMSFASPKRLALLALLAATASLVGCRIVLGFYDRVWALQSYAHQEDSIAAVADSYLRRAKAALDAKDFDAMAREADKVFRLDYYHYPASPTIRRQQALANHFIGCHHARKGDLATAEVKLKAALELNPKLVAAHVSMAAVLLDQGRKAEAKGWIEDGLRLAPEDAELRRLARRADETAK